MASRIEWTERTWNPTLGCARVSPGCDGCYAIREARIRAGSPHPAVAAAYAGLVERHDGRLDWTGTVRTLPERLAAPLRVRKPTRWFVDSMSDLFHEAIPDEYIAQVFAVMHQTPRHTYQVLTKRHGRMRSLFTTKWGEFAELIQGAIDGMYDEPDEQLLREAWPPSNVWLGVSVEDQPRADIRIPALLQTPAAVRWISAEPLLGPVDLTRLDMQSRQQPGMVYDVLGGRYGVPGRWQAPGSHRLDWVVAGGESGPGARPPHPDWFRLLRDQCAEVDVPFLFKQWGDWGVLPRNHADLGVTVANDGTVYQPGELTWPDGSRVGEALRARHNRACLHAMYRVGKGAAGRELDGRLHDAYPAEPARAA